MSNKRDNFLQKTKTALALRANYKCSFRNCGLPTSGPNDLSPDAVTRIGVAAHIHAASPGGPRYLGSMNAAERSDITNGIWLCPTHSTLIDQDEITYTADVIRQMKLEHEQRVANEMRAAPESKFEIDLVAIGSGVVFSGELIGVNGDEWQLRICHFVIGDIHELIQFGDRFEQIASHEQYVLVNSLGDGRRLLDAPSLLKSATGYIVTCRVYKSFLRTNAHHLPKDFALNEDHGIFATNGSIATVSGLDALPQRIKSCLSMQYGESPFYPSVGSRIKEYFDLFRDSPWLAHLIKLEVIRNACVPYRDSVLNNEYTVLQSVSCVHDVKMLPTPPKNDWFTFHFDLTVDGVGRWQLDIPILIPGSDKLSDSRKQPV